MADDTVTMSLERYTPDAKGWVVAAQRIADERQHPEVSPLHLLVAAIERTPAVVEVFRRAGVNVVELTAATERALGALSRGKEPAYLSNRFIDLLDRAEREATRERATNVRVDHLLSALSQEVRGPAGDVFGSFGVTPGALKPHLGVLKSAPTTQRDQGDALSTYCRDLVADARANVGDPVIGRGVELRRLITILERRTKSHPLLVGEPGVGKGAVIRALAGRLIRGGVPSTLSGTRLYEIDIGGVVAGARLRGDVEGRLKAVIDAARPQTGAETIFVVRGVEQLFGGTQSAVGDVLRSAMNAGALRLLGTTTPEGLRRLQEKEPVLVRSLTVLSIEEPSIDAATEILRGIAGRYEEHHRVRIAEGAIRGAVVLAKRYAQDRFLPDSAIDLLDESAATLRVEVDGAPAALDEATERLASLRTQIASLEGTDDSVSAETRQRLEQEASSIEVKAEEIRKQVEQQRTDATANGATPAQGAVLDAEHVARTLAVWTGIPVAKMLEGEAEKLLRMEQRLERRVVGQSEAVRALARAVRRGRVGLRDPRRPIGSFLFLGPSGVGKTELAKALAEFLFDDEAALTRLDMSEFMERHMAQRLLGAPPGYADSEQGGFLTEAVRRRPYSVLLFDEVEKAHQDVFNLLLQVLDDGRLTDGRGRLADFTNTVVIMTSNIGSDRILEADPKLFEQAEGREALRDVLTDQLGRFFRPEFLNRVDDVIVFRPLSRGDLRAIVDIQLDYVRRLLEPRGVKLDVEDAAKDALVDMAYQPALGARPLRRAIVRHVQDPLAEALLKGGFGSGVTIRVSFKDGEFAFAPA